MSKITVYSPKSAPKEVEAPSAFKNDATNMVTLTQALHVYRDLAHKGTALARTRGNVNRTTKKVYKQKGTGNARHGARSAPIYVGGGVAHGPKGVKRILSMSQKMRQSALSLALSLKLKDKKAGLIADLSAITKTKEANELIKKVKDNNRVVTIVLSRDNAGKSSVFRNIKNTKVLTYDSLNAYNTHFGGVMLFDTDIFEIKQKVEKKTATSKKVTKKKVETK